jgi:hypothetical protein
MARATFVARLIAIVQAVGWLLLFALTGLAAAWILGMATGLAANAGPEAPPDPVAEMLARPWRFALGSAVAAAAFAAATWVVGHLADRRSWTALGWGEPRRLLARLGAGVGLGVVMAALAVVAAVLLGGATLRPDAGNAGGLAVPLALGLCAAALSEELAFRGYPLRRLADAVGVSGATGVLAIGFAVAHAWNPHVTPLGTANIVLASVWLAAAFFSRGGMPLAWGLHFGWNAGLSLGFDAPVSGLALRGPLLDYAPGRAAWIDGGAFGPEGGIVATVVFVAGTVLVWRWFAVRAEARGA